MKKFWKWKNQATEENQERILLLNGVIAEESWFDDEVSPRLFKDELTAGDGNITVWINSPGGDCVAAAQIYNMLKEYNGKVTIKVDGIAASAASVIAMAGDEVLMSPVSMMMIHNPMTMAYGNKEEFQKAIAMLNETKESIINAYEIKTGLPRTKLAKLMDAESWMNANKAMELGFVDGIMERNINDVAEQPNVSMMYSEVKLTNLLNEKIAAKCKITKEEPVSERSYAECMERLTMLKNHL